ncbi:TPA: DksA/TraR family C4-type zinc finger protein [Vibrio alginolyticus]|uniref:DksA/TraR family C4-type zinc finger protein n=1 Tax=Vibrio TaxID=662 RepID=UPI0012AE2BFA|nr:MULTISPECIES: DksA/TraR family C4-type zinc finger protein [Vibrio]EGQ7646476.1 DksA/TraR family C4-type zinc finger protein [Vibrio alginolyticus]EGQ7650670.1 DksA/TraR family C4-type zinc finger protein [Vibrio alginolyticus]EKZ8662512.1 DksA/TraR family C4-type zinc finger protein [Vibrio alginolyticus]ELB2749252.1 DksA/TraR family C4-type zinc finger protein [Vibrio alginolyticus]MBS9955742.1 DksA/TraR family C4-type zinc finger protein [Vibrio alginolyticus]
MAVGWANDDSVSQQIQNTIDDEISRVRGSIARGESAHYCDECGDEIPEARRFAMKGVRLCIECQSTIELVYQRQALFNRRASKDSQLR